MRRRGATGLSVGEARDGFRVATPATRSAVRCEVRGEKERTGGGCAVCGDEVK